MSELVLLVQLRAKDVQLDGIEEQAMFLLRKNGTN